MVWRSMQKPCATRLSLRPLYAKVDIRLPVTDSVLAGVDVVGVKYTEQD
jgi:hypothetical protein